MKQATSTPAKTRREHSDIREEFDGAPFGDARLSARLMAMGARLAAKPGAGLPDCIGNDSQLDCAYRFLSNKRVEPAPMLIPHRRQTFERIRGRTEAIVAHDTTEMEFGGDRDGLGPLSKGRRRGFFLHLALAIATGESRQPLGVLEQRCWVRSDTPRPRRNGRPLNGHELSQIPDRESKRWAEQVRAIEAGKPEGVSLIHVADRESDAFEMLEAVQDLRYVLRANHDRRVFDEGEPTHLKDACDRAKVLATIEVPLSPRKPAKQPGAKKAHPEREARVARVELRGLLLDLRKPGLRNGHALGVHVVHAREVDPPEGDAPIDWILYTSEPTDTAEQLQRVLDLYRARWIIEEFFKALKTGCEVQRLQLETYDALRNAVVLHLPIAWHILLLRSLGRAHPHLPAHQVLTRTLLRVLSVMGRRKLSDHPTVADAMLAVAQLGGYLVTKAKRPPGWITLGRGMQRLLDYEQGWLAARAENGAAGDPSDH
jgi:Transposase DNA-binding/Transposase DDE domain